MSMAGSPSWAKLVPSCFGCGLWLLCGAPLDMRDLSLGYSKDEDILQSQYHSTQYPNWSHMDPRC